ncbi:acetyl-CoA synthetase-like protein [Epithele typhae]|uniref:acetyl-CoA synthetase-like protein n=1 Tax=Epithele typhae TaxID=378194 RepID=UPI00200896BF|nr:acetyl-CoA synthetase-like protein [Epithele typhae]KAH9937867.1 acetyl-CoA synthetase-like protein [Epithele typhae]
MGQTDLIDPPPIVTAQGAKSTTWTPIPFYAKLSLPELVAFHAKKSPNHTLFAYLDETGGYKELRYKEFYPAVIRAAKIAVEGVLAAMQSSPPAIQGRIVGVLAVADTISYATFVCGMMHAGIVPFLLSPRNSLAADVHLLHEIGVQELFVSPDAAMQRLATEAQVELAKEYIGLTLLPLPTYEDMFQSHEDDCVGEAVPAEIKLDERGLIVHSSGSSSFPKLITVPRRLMAQWAQSHCYHPFDYCGTRSAAHIASMFRTGMIMTTFCPASPPIIPTLQRFMDELVGSRCTAVGVVPMFLEEWVKDPACIEVLRKLDFVSYGGVPLKKNVAEELLRHGVRLLTSYGMSEIGAIGLSDKTFTLSDADLGQLGTMWEYQRFIAPVDVHRRYIEGEPGVFELVVVESPLWCPATLNTEVGGKRAFETGDLWQEHPTDPRYCRFYGRADDQIMLSTGEKTNPVPMESIIGQDPAVAAAVIFGRGQFQNGVIVQPQEPFDPADERNRAAFLAQIWPSIERANAHAPQHSRLFMGMVIVADPKKPIQRTPKGTPKRNECIADYAAEIQEAYIRIEQSFLVEVSPPSVWTSGPVREFVAMVVRRTMCNATLSEEDDFFQHGCDSLRANCIRGSILQAIRSTSGLSTTQGNILPANFVYANPSIIALSSYLVHTLSESPASAPAEDHTLRVDKMRSLLDKYGTCLPPSNAPTPRSPLDTVVVTGTTGRLGGQILAHLLSLPDKRQRETLKVMGIDPGVLETEKLLFYAADLASSTLGLCPEVYQEVRSGVTVIIHSAWRVDFNVTLTSFEPLIAGVRNLINLALASPVPGGAAMLFVSSLSAVLNQPASRHISEDTLDHGAEAAAGLGYSESKWVAEQLLARASSESGLRTIIARVGQLSGDRRVGAWNTKEWVPALARLSQLAGCVPDKDDTVSWVPIDVAAAALVDFVVGSSPAPSPAKREATVFHLAAPRPVAWRDIALSMAKCLGVPRVPASEWHAKVRAYANDAQVSGARAASHESARELVEFLGSAMQGREPTVATARAVEASKTLRDMRPLGGEDVERWIEHWKRVGFLQT